jgi:uridine monophosphate synthetase
MLTFSERANYSLNPTGQALLRLMDAKETNLCLAADVTQSAALLQIAHTLGPDICLLKTHIDILEDFTPDLPMKLKELAALHRFLIFEDRKFADIGNTVRWQYGGGLYRIADWADLTNAHTVSGPGIIEGLKQVGLPRGRGLVLLAQMSSKGSLAHGHYTQATLRWAQENAEFVIGFICTQKLLEEPSFIHMTPGVQLESVKDALGQQYVTPSQAIGSLLSDLIIVGRGIYEASDPKAIAAAYRKAAWSAYLTRL